VLFYDLVAMGKKVKIQYAFLFKNYFRVNQENFFDL